MSNKNWIQLIVGVCILLTPILFQNCSASHDEGSGSFTSRSFFGASACDPILLEGWVDYRDALATGALCLNCHTSGGPAGKPFADSDMDVSFQSLLDESEEKIWSFALNPGHKAGFTGPQNESILQPLRDNFKDAEAEYATCIADSGGQIPPDGLPTPDIKSAALTIPDAAAILDNPQELTFTVNGFTLTMDVAAWETDIGNRGYDFSLPTVTAGGQTLYVKNMGIYLNDTIIPAPAGSAFQNVNRYVAAGTTRALFSSGVMNATYDTLATNSIAVAFEIIENAPNVTFTPATYEELVNGVFAQSCAGCHGANNPDGNISLVGNSYTANYLNGLFIPFDEDSQILDSVVQGRMPPAAPLPQADIELIRGWILDGAPRE